ncbi:MAG: CRISPR-associated endonuclease Cas2 [Armatimonadetes bacterium]|nr:CRISPR-associated endonuclease Cas2 [Armatimonadota bacterium]
MYVIMVYDVNTARVQRVLKTGRRYLTWVQNSVFEGEITEAKLARLISSLRKVIDPTEDSVLFYILRTDAYLERRTLGVVKNEPTQFI